MTTTNKLRRGFLERLFGLSEDSARLRKWVVFLINPAAVLILGGLASAAMLAGKMSSPNTGILAAGIFLKYLILLYAIYRSARKISVEYFNHIHELTEEKMVSQFFGEVVFGKGNRQIEISGGHISDETSPLVIVGGPGDIRVGFDNVVLLENADGRPRIIYPDKKPTQLERFEKIRRVSESQFAIISLEKHRIEGVSMTTRTKDGITVHAEDVKIIYSLHTGNAIGHISGEGINSGFNPYAVSSLIYKQAVTSPSTLRSSSLKSLLNEVVLSLIQSEVEKFAASYTADEIFASVRHSDADRIQSIEKRIARLQSNGTPEPPRPSQTIIPAISSTFQTSAFAEKCAAIGVQVEGVNIGEWRYPSSITEKFLESEKLLSENEAKLAVLESDNNPLIHPEFVNLVDDVIRLTHERVASLPEVNPRKEVLNLLKSFRMELVAAREAILTADEPRDTDAGDLKLINEAIRQINLFLSREEN